MLRVLKDLDVSGMRVLLRVDFNVSVNGGDIVDDFRIRASLPTVKTLKKRGAKAIILLSHRGRPAGMGDELSLQPLTKHIAELLSESITFLGDCAGPVVEDAIAKADDGQVFLLENLRFHEGEDKNDPGFAQALARLGDCFVLDAFGAAHRGHASIVGLSELLPSAAGPLFEREVRVLTRMRDEPKTPFVIALGGAKISDKLPLIEHFLPKVSALCLGGALGNTVLSARGMSVGRSRVEREAIVHLPEELLHHSRLLLPVDAVVADDPEAKKAFRTCAISDIRENEYIFDIGPKTARQFSQVISESASVFFNGPMGIAEKKAFRGGTEALIRAMANSSAFTILGGGDTVLYPFMFGLADRFGFLSTGGGATLEFLSGRTLPGVAALSS